MERFYARHEAPRRLPGLQRGPLRSAAEKLFRGPIADALTHIGQITMLRRMSGVPVRGENYYRPDQTGIVGPNQPQPAFGFG